MAQLIIPSEMRYKETALTLYSFKEIVSSTKLFPLLNSIICHDAAEYK